MSTSAVGQFASSAAATLPSDGLTMNMLKKAMNADAAAMIGMLQALPDPSPSKGQNFDSYA